MQLLARPFLPCSHSLPISSCPAFDSVQLQRAVKFSRCTKINEECGSRDSGAAVGVFNVSISAAWKWAKCLHKNHSAAQKRVKRAIVKRELRFEPPRSNFAFSSLWATGMKSLRDRCGVPTPHSGAGVISLMPKLKQ